MSAEQCSYEYWLGPREAKHSGSGVERSVRPSATIRRARAALDIIGVTKVADVTDLDRIGIPNFMTVRPHDLGPGISYYNGKGTTREQAEAGALMEAVERHAGERYEGSVMMSSHYNLRRRHACVDPLEIHSPRICNYSEDLLLEWVLGFDLLTRRPTFVPLNCVVAPYTASSGMPLFYSSTNGLASGNTRLEALCHALCEVIERDAAGVTMARTHIRPAVGTILADMGFSGGPSSECDDAPLISLRGLPRSAATLVRKMQRAGLDVCLRNLTSATGIPTIGCTITEPDGSPLAVKAHSGCGTHPDARIALTRALTEAAQTRLGFIQGGREDLSDFDAPEGLPPTEGWPGDGPVISFDQIASCEHSTVNEDVEFIIERMHQSGFDQAIVVDVTRVEVGIPVVRVVAPRAEDWTLYLAHGGRAGLGHRALQQVQHERKSGKS
ncbi:YcaO-like family protein [Bradyrhizobium sp.]|uniref:YcaO-like family protein n=1 Tax=Bradyrhizobium sp. TaxID=376 RepID=UPI000A46F9D8|nr:YcaO-like family protein [Bradyrhizobium sp.]